MYMPSMGSSSPLFRHNKGVSCWTSEQKLPASAFNLDFTGKEQKETLEPSSLTSYALQNISFQSGVSKVNLVTFVKAKCISLQRLSCCVSQADKRRGGDVISSHGQSTGKEV